MADFTVTLSSDGGVAIKDEFRNVADAADASADKIAKSYDRTAIAAEKAEQRRVEARQKAEAQFAQLTGSGSTAAPAQSSLAPQAIGSIVDQRRMQAAAQALRDQLDPAAASQHAFNKEVETAKQLLARGVISEVEYAGAVGIAETALKKSLSALNEHSNGLGLNRMQYITAQSAVLRFADSVIAGRNPLTAFALEAHKGAEVLSLDEGGMAGGLSKVSRLITPASVGVIALTAAVIGGTAAAYSYATQLDKLTAAAEGFGRTSQISGDQLMAVARQNAGIGDISVKSAQDIEATILHQTRTSADALGKAISITQKFADAMGIDAKKGAEELGKAMADPAKAAEELTNKYGYLTQAQVEEIRQLMEQNRLTDAQSALMGHLGVALDEAGDHVSALTKLWRLLAETMSQGWSNIGAGINHALGSFSDAEKVNNLREKIAADNSLLQDRRLVPFGRNQIEARLRQEMTDLGKLGGDMQRRDEDARHNQLAQEVLDIERTSGATNKYSRTLEEHRQVIARLHDAMKQGIAVDPTVLAGKEHQLRGEELIGGEGNREVALQQARARMKNAMPRSPARAAAARDIEDIMTAGRDMTDQQAAAAAAARGQGALGHPKAPHSDKHAETLAREAAAMVADTAATLKLGEAYLKSGDAALVAEAYRKAATEATKKGIDIQAQFTRELNLMAAQEIAGADKKVRSLEDETAGRRGVLDLVNEGKLPAIEMNAELAKESALRPLLALRAHLHGDALRDLIATINAYTGALHGADTASKAWAAQEAVNAANDNARADRLRGTLADVRDPAERARRTALDHADAKGWSTGDAIRLADAESGAATAKRGADTNEFEKNEQHRIALSRELLAVELQYAGAKNQDEVEAIVRQQLIIQNDEQHLTLTDQQIAALARLKVGEIQLTKELDRQKAGWQELRDVGANALEQLLSPDGIKNWGDTFKSVLKSILIEIEKLAIINPLLNTLFGGSRPTAGGGGGGILGTILGAIFGGGGGGSKIGGNTAGLETNFDAVFPAHAAGTSSAPGGWSLVGEEGPEIVNLPRGAGVLTAQQTRTAMSSSGGPVINMPITLNAQGAGPREIDVLRMQVNQLQRTIPAIAVQAVNDASSRRIGRAA